MNSLKKMLLVSAIVLSLCSPAYAQDDLCNAIGDAARDFMVLRQVGSPLADVMNGVLQSPLEDEMLDLVLTIVYTAYSEYPVYAQPLEKLDTAVAYGKLWKESCLEVMGKEI